MGGRRTVFSAASGHGIQWKRTKIAPGAQLRQWFLRNRVFRVLTMTIDLVSTLHDAALGSGFSGVIRADGHWPPLWTRGHLHRLHGIGSGASSMTKL